MPARTVDDFVKARVLPEFRPIVAMIRALVKQTVPEAQEIISYGIPAFKAKRILAVISPTKKGITLAFSRGAEFEDKHGLLEGVGKVSKNVRMRTIADVNKPALRDYLNQALKLDRE